MQVPVSTVDLRDFLPVLEICCEEQSCTKVLLGQKISYNTIPPGEDMLHYVHVHT